MSATMRVEYDNTTDINTNTNTNAAPDTRVLIASLWSKPPFDRVDPALLAQVAEHVVVRQFNAGDTLLARGAAIESLFFVCAGRVRLGRDGSLLTELVAGEAFPLEALALAAADQSVDCDHLCPVTTICLELPHAQIILLQDESPSFREFCQFRTISFRQREQRAFGTTGTRKNSLEKELGHFVSASLCPVVDLTATIRETALAMHHHHADAVAVVDGNGAALGIFTLHDMLRRVVVPAVDLNARITTVMTAQPKVLPATANAFAAAMEMAQHGMHHVVVTDGNDVIGIVSGTDLSRTTAGLTHVRDQIHRALDAGKLSEVARDIRALAVELAAEGVDATRLTSIISTLNDQLTSRLIDIEAARHGLASDQFCWISLGSEGRHEQTLHTDQDNALIFVTGPNETPAQARPRFLVFSRAVNEGLDLCGFPLCKGNVMASNPDCCLSLDEWRSVFGAWMTNPEPDALLNATIYFDFRAIFGRTELAQELSSWLQQRVRHNSRFLVLMTANAGARKPPIGFFRDFSVDKSDGCLDLKTHGAAIFVDAARILTLGCGLSFGDPGTITRFRAAASAGKITAADAENWIAAFRFVQSVRMRAQLAQVAAEQEFSNRINPYGLNNLDRKSFLEALRQADHLQKMLTAQYGAGERM